MTKRTKQEIIDSICLAIGEERLLVSRGSSEPAELFGKVAAWMQLAVTGKETKPALGSLIVQAAGLGWTEDCDATGSASGGGSTVTAIGLERIEEAVHRVADNRWRDKQVSRISEGQSFEINIQPEASALRIFRSMSFTPWYALGEFIDNSITSALLNIDALKIEHGHDYRLRVTIEFDESQNMLTVSDNAAGIERGDIARAMKTSEPPIDTSRGLSLHGVGMKAAAFWWGRTLELETHSLVDGTGWSVSVDLNNLDENSSGFTRVLPLETQHASGTTIRIRNVWPERYPRTRTPSSIKKFLPSIYRSFVPKSSETNVRNGSPDELLMDLIFMGSRLTYAPPQFLEEQFWPTDKGPGPGPKLLWRDDVTVHLSSGKKISGWLGIQNQLSRELAGFFLHYRGKGIAGVAPVAQEGDEQTEVRSGSYKPALIFDQAGSYRDQSYIGEFDVSAFGKTITTDSVMWAEDEEREFLEKLLEFMQRAEKDYWRQAKNVRRRLRNQFEAQRDETNRAGDAQSYSKVLEDAHLEHGDARYQGTSHALSPGSGDPAPVTFSLSDKEGHTHTFEVQDRYDWEGPFLEFHTQQDGQKNLVIINANHPGLGMQCSIDGNLQVLLNHIAVQVVAAELLIGGIEPDRLRRKLNENMEQARESKE